MGTLPSHSDGESAGGTGSQEVPELLVTDMAGQFRDQSSQQNETQGAEPIGAQGHTYSPQRIESPLKAFGSKVHKSAIYDAS
jgi:hypothetical protein